MTRDFAIRPQQEYRPVSTPNTKNADTVTARSTTNSPMPMSTLLYFLRIIARISVPPPDASILNNTAEATAGRRIAKISSSIG